MVYSYDELPELIDTYMGVEIFRDGKYYFFTLVNADEPEYNEFTYYSVYECHERIQRVLSGTFFQVLKDVCANFGIEYKDKDLQDSITIVDKIKDRLNEQITDLIDNKLF